MARVHISVADDPRPAPCASGRGFRSFGCPVYPHCTTVAGRRKWPGMTCVLCPMAIHMVDVATGEAVAAGGDCPRCRLPLGRDGLCACHVDAAPDPDRPAGEATAIEERVRELLAHFNVPLLAANGAPACRTVECRRPQGSRLGLCARCYRARRRELADPCTVDGCESPQLAKGLCSRHYSRQHRGATQ